jgi:hypothetical protein
MNAMFRPEDSGFVFPSSLEVELTLGTAAFGTTPAWVMMAPAGGGDVGFYGKFTIPQDYVDTPVLVIRGILEGVSNTIGFGLQQTGGIADNEAVDIAYEAEDLASVAASGWSAEDMFEETITITPSAAYVAGDEVFFFFYREDGADDQTTEFYLTGLFFRYNDA